MPSIEVLHVPSEKFTHDRGYPQFAALKQKVDMGVHKNPGVYGCSRFCNVFIQAMEKSGPIFVVRKNYGLVYPSYHNEMQGTRNIEAGLSWHQVTIVA
jgi:hypothetical protein